MAISELRSAGTLKLRALLWLYSNRNIVGCALACLGPALLFAGVIRDGWLWITAGLYLLGALAAPSPLNLERRIAESLSLEELLARLDTLVNEVRAILPPGTLAHLESIRGAVHDVLPRLVGQDGGAAHAQFYTVRETVMSYLPETLANYAALPAAFRVAHPLKDGKTARQLLDEQLTLLDAQLKEIVLNVASGDAQALMSNGRFLQDRFSTADFTVS